MTNYPYASGDLLEKGNTYFYTPYAGTDFLDAWRFKRDEAAASMTRSTSDQSKGTSTAKLLYDLILSLARGTLGAEEWLQIDKLLQRFEVSKRLYTEYTSDWRPVDPNNFRSMELYLRFAELMDLAYQSSAKIQYLNGLLKSLDTISALVIKIDQNQFLRLVRLISRERNHVENIAGKLNVSVRTASKGVGS